MNKTDIVNNCLLFLGLKNINNLGQNSEIAKIISTQYDNCLRELMDEQPYDFGYRIVSLARIPDSIDVRQYDIRFKYAYYLPQNCMFLKYVSTEGALQRYCPENDEDEYRYDRFRQVNDGKGRIIVLSNVPQAYALYYEKQEDVNVYPIDFANAFSMLLAVKISQKATDQVEKLNASIQMFNYYRDIALAKSLNRQYEYKTGPKVPNFLKDR